MRIASGLEALLNKIDSLLQECLAECMYIDVTDLPKLQSKHQTLAIVRELVLTELRKEDGDDDDSDFDTDLTEDA